jgi:hypothetical protein
MLAPSSGSKSASAIIMPPTRAVLFLVSSIRAQKLTHAAHFDPEDGDNMHFRNFGNITIQELN